MEAEAEIHRCPSCDALVVDRRSSSCTTCHNPLPQEWVLTPEQIAKLSVNDAHARAEHATSMDDMDVSPDTAPGVPLEEPPV